jgi:hypothetical protein
MSVKKPSATEEFPYGTLKVKASPDGTIARPYVMTVFLLRNRLEGREQLLSERVEKISKSEKMHQLNALWKALKEEPEWGGVNTEELYKWWDENREFVTIDNPAANIVIEEDKKGKDDQEKLDAIIFDLPNTAKHEDEFNWLMAHPAHIRRSRLKADKQVIITPDDLLNTPSGPCPSSKAAMLLIRYVNNQGALDKLISSNIQKEQKATQQVATKVSEFDDMDDLTELNKMIEEAARIAKAEATARLKSGR